MIRVTACLFCQPRATSLSGVILHPIERDGGEGFFYAQSARHVPGDLFLPPLQRCATRKEYARGRFS